MKKIFTILTVVALTTTVSFAQVQWGATAGLNMANVSYSGSGDMDSDMRLGIRLGVTVDITLSDAMTLNTGAIYSVKGYSGEMEILDFTTFTVSTVDYDQSFNYIEVPLHVSYAVSDQFSLMAGPYLGILVGNSATLDGEDLDTDTDGMAAMDLGINVGAGFAITDAISVNAAYQMGLTQLDEDGESDLYNTNILIGMTYSFGGRYY
jgi:opacity protein-like surface antigen